MDEIDSKESNSSLLKYLPLISSPYLFSFIVISLLMNGCRRSSITFTLYYIGNILGEYTPCDCPQNPLGGIERIPTIINQARKIEKNFLFVVAGNSLFPSLILTEEFKKQAEIKAQLIFNSLFLLNPRVVGVGKKDLVDGLEFIKKLEKNYPIKLVSANLKTLEGEYIFSPFIVEEIKNYKVGITGVTGKISLKNGIFRGDPENSLKGVLKQLKDRGCDFIILLSDLEEEEEREIIGKFKEIDLIISSGSEFPTKEPLRFEKTILVRPYPKLRYIGKLKFSILGNGVKYDLENIPVSKEIEPDSVVEELVLKTKTLIKSIEGDVKRLFQKIPEGYVGKERCGKCHREQFDFWMKTSHARAYATLKEKNEELNLDCIPCHATGYITKGFMEDVQCEACHGEGKEHSEYGRGIKRNVEYGDCIKCHEPQRFGDFDYSKIGAVKCP
jgi:2',3'-cyclic-nucleotide 2'-phosphodiesterase (5'-nucleotidase family)